MPRLPSLQAESALKHLAQRFAHWRHSRATPRERIPSSLWEQAVSLTHTLPFSRVARGLGLCPNDLKKRGRGKPRVAALAAPPAPVSFVEVTAAPPRPAPAVELEVHRPDGARLRLSAGEATAALASLVQTFLESR